MNKKIKRCCVPENRNYVAVLSSELDRLESVLPCGHPASLAINSAETGELLYCELCDDKSARRDAEQRERELQAERDALRALLRRVLSCGLNEEPHGVGFTPSRQEKKAGELARDIEAALGKEQSNAK